VLQRFWSGLRVCWLLLLQVQALGLLQVGLLQVELLQL
jgi:hypothetical protein